MGCFLSRQSDNKTEVNEIKKFNGPRFKIRFGSKIKNEDINNIKILLPSLNAIRGIRSVKYTIYINNKVITFKIFYYHSIDGTKSIQLIWDNEKTKDISTCSSIYLVKKNKMLNIFVENIEIGSIEFDKNITIAKVIDCDIHGEYVHWNFSYNIISPLTNDIYTNLLGYKSNGTLELFNWNMTKTRTNITTTSECIDKNYILIKKINKFIPQYAFTL